MSLLLIGLAVLILVAPGEVWAAIIVLLIAFVVGESVLRGTFVRTVNRVAVILALVAIVVLFAHYWELTLVALLVALAAFLLIQRLRELRA
jgi:hypothetical protein